MVSEYYIREAMVMVENHKGEVILRGNINGT